MRIYLEWGKKGLENLNHCNTAIIVDVLSFSTCVDAACSRNAEVYPLPLDELDKPEYAKRIGAALAGKRGSGVLSLSPVSLLNLDSGSKIVLPSPNGSMLSFHSKFRTTLSGCLRNVEAISCYANDIGDDVAVIPAGERWPDGSICFALEDYLGAGAIINCLSGEKSAEAKAAELLFRQYQGNLLDVISKCKSGIELIERGFTNDVEFACRLNHSKTAPLLEQGCYRNTL